ncbi:MAG TPA: SDR family oxidoreductase [Anaerolineae bacterium]|nr:SDR family oxidoreductase [Anaerolineae bacterium]
MVSLTRKVALITGASTGIGRATAFAFRAAGARVALAARSSEALASLAEELGGPDWAIAIPTDVSDSDQCERFVAEAVAHFGRADVLVNNAGMIVSGLFEHLEPGDAERQMQVNFFGALYCTRAALPHLKASRGVIINVSSVAGLLGTPTTSVYSASKAAMNAWSRALRVELKPHGVDVVTVCPYFTSGVQLAQKGILRKGSLHNRPGQRRQAPGTQTADQVAQAILRAAQRPSRIVVLSWAGKLIWRIDRLAPWLVDWVMIKGLAKLSQK